MTQALVSLVTALADDELILGHRHSEWTGYAPHIEEDVAFSSIAQDEIGHAAALYSLIADSLGVDPDQMALGRKPSEYRNALLCEKPNQDWAFTLARHWLYDTADSIRLNVLEGTRDERLAGLIGKIRREERWHQIHADTWMKRIAHGPMEGRAKIAHAVAEALPETAGLFEPIDDEDQAIEEGLLPVPSQDLQDRFLTHIDDELEKLGLPSYGGSEDGSRAEFVASSSGDLIETEKDPDHVSEEDRDALGGRRGRHTDAFNTLWEEMTSTYRGDPGATW